MPKDKQEDEVENVFKLTILVPVIQYLEAFIDTQHNLSPDEFLKAIYAPENPKSTRCSKTDLYSDSCVVNPPEILPKKLQIPPVALQKPIAQLFFEVIRLRPFLSNVYNEFRKRRNRRCQTDVSQTIAITYVLIYRTSIGLISDAINCLINFKVSKMLGLMSFLLTPELASSFYIAGCDIFDKNFVEEKILDPFVKALPIIQTIFAKLLDTNRRKYATKKFTVPIQMNVLKYPKKFPPPPVCTPEKVLKRPVKPVPKTLYKMPDMESKMSTLRQEHRVQAAQRLEDANAKAPACFKSKKSKKHQRVLEEIAEMRMKSRLPIIAKKNPTFKNVTVKKTTATILREGALIANNEVKEVEKLNELMKGSFDPAEVQKLEDEIRQCEKEENLRKIEERHLSGLISYEESLLAKQQLVKDAKEQGDRVRSEREELNAKLEKFRLEETEKLKRTVEKCHDAEQAVKNAYNFMVGEKRGKAAEVAEESRRIRLCLIENKEEEFRRKLQVIREIKMLQAFRGLRVKEFDPTERNKLGLLCEMSLAELKERLFLVKGKWQDELTARREVVKDRRRRQKDLVEFTQKTINEYRVAKQSFLPSRSVLCDHSKILQTPELEALRQKLDERRMERFQKINPSRTNVIFESKLFKSSECCSSV